MHASQDWSDDLGELQAFAEALVVDEEGLPGAQLAARLVRQATFVRLAKLGGGALRPKARMFREFVALHRRITRKAGRESDGDEPKRGAGVRANPVAEAVRRLPLDLREALLLVVLSRFSHRDAAQTLEIALPQLHERLREARARLAQSLEGGASASMRRAPHLRLVK